MPDSYSGGGELFDNPANIIELRAMLLSKHSKEQKDQIVELILHDTAKLPAAIWILCHGDYREVQRVAWVLSGVAEKQPTLLLPWLPLLRERLDQDPLPDAVKRNVMRIFSLLPLPEGLHSDLIHVAFRYAGSPSEPVAVRSFAISVLEKLAAHYPEIGLELKELLRMELEKNPSPGVKSKTQNILSRIKKKEKG